MKLVSVLFLLSVSTLFSSAQTSNHAGPLNTKTGSIIHVRTVLGHVSLLEFKEPVTAAAAGSKAFHIERFENKVLITPLKSGVATNLFVWTATQRFDYELDLPADTANASLAVDAPGPELKPTVDLRKQQTQLLTETLLANGSSMRRIDSSRVKPAKETVAVRIESILRTNEMLYVFFTVDNQSKQPFRVIQPNIYRLEPEHSSISLWSFVNQQLDSDRMARIGSTKSVSVSLSYADFQDGDIPSGARKAGVVAIPLAASSPTMLRLIFADGVRATFVL